MARTADEIVSDLVRNVLVPAPWATLSLDRPIVRLPRPAASHAAWRGLPESHLAEVFRHLPVPEILRLGYLFTPRWREVWRLYPLYLHDRQFASLPIPRSEVANAITNVLEDFVGGEDVDPGLGPVHTFSVESTEWGLNHADRWCEALRKGKVVEVVLFNRGSSDQSSMLVHLPPRLLECTTVQILHLAFFTLEVGELAVFTDTIDLGLHGCACPNGVIERVVAACRHLKRLSVHDGAMDSIVVKSARCLAGLSMRRTVSRSLTVDDVPVLLELILGSADALSIRGAPQLADLVRLNLPDTRLKIEGVEIAVGSQALEPQMPSVRKLWLGLDYTALRGMEEGVVQQMLMRFPGVDRLIIERKDDVPQEEGLASRDDAHTHGHLHLYHGHLHTLRLSDFRAGKAELELLKALIDRTHELRTVELVYRDGRDGIEDATAEVRFALHQFVNDQCLQKHPFELCIGSV